MFDLILTGGRMIDGTGAREQKADLGIQGDRIQAIDDLSGMPAGQRLDVTGLCVCPGFIDVHSHSDAYLLIESAAPSKIYQGITTEIIGNCGVSAAPLKAISHLPSDWLEQAYPKRWHTLTEYLACLAAARPAVNVGILTGHGKIRAWVMGYGARPASAKEREAMSALLSECLEAGSLGLSTGLIYAPGMFAGTDELIELAHVVARYHGIYTTHMRSEGPRLLEAIEETLRIGRETGVRLQISHLKTSGRRNWGLLDRALALIRAAQAEGLSVAADRYPYTASSTDLDVIFPSWAAEGGREVVLQRLRTPSDRARLRAELDTARSEEDWASIIIGSTARPAFRGRRLTPIAADLQMAPVDAALQLIDTDELKTGAFFLGMNESNLWRILAEPWVMIGTDASLRAPTGPLSQDYPHPRAYGTFPRFLRAVLDGQSVSLPEAIRKMTSLAADHFGLPNRGRLAVGAHADVVAFSPTAIRDTATFEQPHQLATGVELVVVNGAVTLKQGALTGQAAGRILKRV